MISAEEYPKVLIVNFQSLYKDNATGITLRSLWGEWPKDRVMEIHLDITQKIQDKNQNAIETLSPAICPILKLAYESKAQKVNQSVKAEGTTAATHKRKKELLRQAIICAVDSFPVYLSAGQKKQIDNFHPQAIYTLGSGVAAMSLCNYLSRKYDIPIIIHFMDNWPEKLQWEENPFVKPYAWLVRKKMRKCLLRSRKSIAISPSMAEAYEKKFGMPFAVLMNSVDVEHFRCQPKPRGEILHFLYAGGFHLERWKALRDIAECLQNQKAVLDIYTEKTAREQYEAYFKGLPVEFHDPVIHEHIKDVLETADILVHVETNNPLMSSFFKYSISTKIPEYMASGRPILFYGPKSLGLYQYLCENKAAETASDLEDLKTKLHAITAHRDLSVFTENAINLSRQNHDLKYTHQCLLESVKSNISYWLTDSTAV